MCALPSRLVALWCWYHGAPFRGYQSQPQGPTVQDSLLAGLRAAGLERNPVPSGRTDLGVHARMQVLSMRLVEALAPEEVPGRLNPHLPAGLGVALAHAAPAKFHASWSASGKEYRYRLHLGAGPERAGPPTAWRVDVRPERVAELLARAVGTRDFFAFHDKSSAVRPRVVQGAEVVALADGRVEVRLRGEGFARYMVRLLVGSAVAVARGEVPEEAYLAGLEAARPFGAVKAPAHGLVLWEVFYPPAVDPFSAEERRLAPGVPGEPPFT